MEKLMEDYAAFERAMDEGKVYLDLDFEEICTALGADKDALDRLILNETGYSGQGLVVFYHSNFANGSFFAKFARLYPLAKEES